MPCLRAPAFLLAALVLGHLAQALPAAAQDEVGIVRLGRASRHPDEVGRPHLVQMIALGVSPRAFQHILALARVTAFLSGRDYVLPADVKSIFPDAARHRIARSVRAEVEDVATDAIVAELLEATGVP